MRSAVDTTILLDILLPDEKYAEASLSLLESHAARGALVICPVAYAETAAAFSPTSAFEQVAEEMGLAYDEFSPEVAILAAQMWQDYRRRGGPRRRIIADFLIGAHAQLRADRLLSRDRGYFRDYFQGLTVVGP
jgi:predicted nucleic acid-binding protein